MKKRRRAPEEDPDPEPESEQPSQTEDPDAWDSPDFLRSRLINLAFVTAPAIVMVALGEPKIGAAWFAVGISIVIFDSRRQLRGFWRSLRSR